MQVVQVVLVVELVLMESIPYLVLTQALAVAAAAHLATLETVVQAVVQVPTMHEEQVMRDHIHHLRETTVVLRFNLAETLMAVAVAVALLLLVLATTYR